MFEYEGFEVSELVAEYQVYRQHAPSDMVVKVYQYESGKYEGRCNYSYWGPDQIEPYQRDVPQSATKEDAVKDVLRSLLVHHRADYSSDQFAWVKTRDPQEIIVLGSGELVTREEFMSMRAERKANKRAGSK